MPSFHQLFRDLEERVGALEADRDKMQSRLERQFRETQRIRRTDPMGMAWTMGTTLHLPAKPWLLRRGGG